MTQDLSDNSLTLTEENLNISEETEVFVFPASFAQARLWFLHQLAPENPFYNVGCAIRLTGNLNYSALQQTFNQIVRRHEVLRTTFVMVDGQPMQAIPTANGANLPLPVINLQHLSTTERETQALKLATAEAQRPFDLATGALLRVKLLQLDRAEYVLLLNLHHIVADGWSIGVLIGEIGALYTAFVREQPSPLPPLPIQYADFAEWQREYLQSEVAETQLAYWREQLIGMGMLNLPADKPRPAIPTYRGAKQFLELSHPLSAALKELSQQENVTLFITLLAAFQTLLYRYTGQEDIVVGSPIANRNRSEIEKLIGFFVNSLVLRTDLSGNPTFRELLARVKEVALGAYAHQDLPFEQLVECLHPERDLSRNPLFQISFALQNTPVSALELPELTLSLLEYDSGTAKLDLEFHLWEDLDSLNIQVVYSTDLFNDSTIARMLGHFQTLLEGIVANREQRISNLPILTESERHQLLVEFNQKLCAFASLRAQNPKSKTGQCIHQLFEAQVELAPDAIAVEFEDKQLTYRELNIRANQLAHYLQQLGVAPDVLVGICVERSIEMIVGVLGILKAGGAYVPLDPTYPLERLSFMLADANVPVLLTQKKLAQILTSGDESDNICEPLHTLPEALRATAAVKKVYLDKDWEAMPAAGYAYAQHSPENPTSKVTADKLAYVIYTSGSTGKPKGVLIQHRGLCNLAEAQIEAFNLQPTNRVLQFASLSFDASIFEIVMALGAGGTLCLANRESLLPGQGLIQLLRDCSITHVTLPPAVLAVLPKAELPALRTIICAGEFCSEDIVKRWWRTGRRFFNAYGVTEATVWSTIAEVSDTSSGKPPIGRAIANTQVYILDAHLQPVPIGIPGEMYIGGDGVARGYLNRPELTAEKFISHPFVGAGLEDNLYQKQTTFPQNPPPLHPTSSKERLYKTGDLARYLPDGNIEFLGRIDEQVKIRGFRIELGEIEAVLSQHPAVARAVVIIWEEVPGDKQLVAYVVPIEQLINPKSFIQNLKSTELRQFLKQKLPAYMVPSTFVVLDSLPLTPNGKVNRRNLPAPDEATSLTVEKAFVAPRTPTESALAQIWAEVLHLERVGIGDNFFDLGGDSLLAIRLIDRIGKQFQRELPLSTLFLAPTIEGLASHLSSGTDSLHSSPLVAIQPKGKNPPFFCVHPILGVVFPYYELAYHLGTNQPFYALQPLGIDGEQTPLTRIEDMAAYYISALRVVQPNGPYFIGGWSFGGLVAFEMAQQLQKAGHQVAQLAILDTLAPVRANKPSFWDGFKFLLTTVSRNIWPFLLDYFYLRLAPDKHPSDGNVSWNSILGQMAIANLMPEETRGRILNSLTIRPMWRVFQANSQATLSYVPQTYPGRITLYRSSEQPRIARQNPTVGWSELAMEPVEIHTVPGNHLTMLRKPNVQVLAEKLMANC
jgi:amino acid adenylation domain-containing protein